MSLTTLMELEEMLWFTDLSFAICITEEFSLSSTSEFVNNIHITYILGGVVQDCEVFRPMFIQICIIKVSSERLNLQI